MCHINAATDKGLLNVKDKIIKLLGENKGEYLQHLRTKKNLFHKAKDDSIKEKMDTLGCVKIKNCLSKYTINRVERQARKWETMFANYTMSKELDMTYVNNF